MKSFLKNILLFTILFIVFISLIGFKIENSLNVNSIHYKTRWKEYYEKDYDVDLIFLGSSHAYRSFVPSVFDSILGTKSFNLGSSSQSLITSYYVLKEVLENDSPKNVILEVFPGTTIEEDNYRNSSFHLENMQGNKTRLELWLESDNLLDAIELILPAYRFNNYKKYALKEANADAFVRVDGSTEDYYDRGYVRVVPTDDYKEDFKFEEVNYLLKEFSPRKQKYLQKIIDLCEEESIELTLVTQAFNPDYFKNYYNYGAFSNHIDSIAKSNNIRYIDSNYSDKHQLTSSDYYDSGHLFYSGALKFSTYIAEELKGE